MSDLSDRDIMRHQLFVHPDDEEIVRPAIEREFPDTQIIVSNLATKGEAILYCPPELNTIDINFVYPLAL